MRRLLCVLLVAVTAVAAGCGGGGGGGGASKPESRDQYTKDLQQASQTLQKSLTDIGTAAQGNAGAAASKIDQGGKALDDTANRLAKINPPSNVKAAHGKLVAALHSLADTYRGIADAARKGDRQALVKALQGLTSSDAVKSFVQAANELKAKGITVPSGG